MLFVEFDVIGYAAILCGFSAWLFLLLLSHCCIIPASNERNTIKEKINNLEQSYPQEHLKIIVVLNNSTDETQQICQQHGIHVIESAPGKLNALEAGRQAADTEFILASDCDVLLRKDALKILVSRLAQEPENVCAISAYHDYNFETDSKAAKTLGEHEILQSKLRYIQGEIASSCLIHGTCYIYKKNIFPSYCLEAIEDELSMGIKIVRNGYRLKTNLEAKCFQSSPISAWYIFKMSIRHCGRQIHTCLKNMDIIFNSTNKIFGLFIFPFYMLLPRFLPLSTILILLIPLRVPVPVLPFYMGCFILFTIIAAARPFLAIQVVSLHLGWFYAWIYRKKGTAWNNTGLKTDYID
jgi:cellulose synthase/poly-beta-1,6-N-acetylglucosamine synthase-like glycosyltransferase